MILEWQDELKRILDKDVNSLTDSDLEFLIARQSYLTVDQANRLFSGRAEVADHQPEESNLVVPTEKELSIPSYKELEEKAKQLGLSYRGKLKRDALEILIAEREQELASNNNQTL